MPGLTSAGEALILTPLTTTAYISLHTADPGNTGANEVAGGTGYVRQLASFTNAGANPTVASNNAIVVYAVATGVWGTISYYGVWDAVSGGNIRGSGLLTSPKSINNGDTARFIANALTITAQ